MSQGRRKKVAVISAALACFSAFGFETTASARDNGGVADFFAREFGLGNSQPQSEPSPFWSEDNPYDRPLVVRPQHRRLRAPRAVAVVKGQTGPVSIYEDKTLRRGDAVMTAQGIRIFNGSDSLPYRDSDFVAISEGRVSRDVAKTLTAIDHMPRS